MSPPIRRVLIALTVVAVIAAAFWWFSRPKPIVVVVSEIERGKVESSIANTRAGTVEACQRTKLSPIMGGRIEVLAVKEGDRVKKGPLLMKLWNDGQQAQRCVYETVAPTIKEAPVASTPTAPGRNRVIPILLVAAFVVILNCLLYTSRCV